MNPLLIVQLAMTVGPSVVQAVEHLFGHKPKGSASGTKQQAALQMVQAGIITALELDPAAFGAPEKQLITDVNDSIVRYYNAKGWPVPASPVPAS